MSSLYPTLALTMAAAATTSVVAEIDGSPPPRRSMPYLRNDDLRNLMPKGADPSALENWMSVDKDVEFLPLLNQDPKAAEKMTPEATRKLEEEMSARKLWGHNNNPYSVQPFAEGLSEYDEYQTAWRLLGFMVDCDTENDDDYQISYHSGSSDYNETEFTSENGCRRYVMWGAYVDLDYAGDGIAEYQYWDAKKHSWDKNACKYADSGNSRCAKMDCHLDNTNWHLLGVFKHNNYMEWFGQLFKHEGVCIWSEEQYAFMKTAKKGWPKACTDTGHRVAVAHNENSSGTLTSVYYDVKPLQGGRMGLALYTDDECLEEHSTSTYHMESIIGNIFANAASHHSNDYQDDDAYENLSLKNALSKWDEAFKVWNTCHPCKAHDLENYDGTKYMSSDDYYGRKLQGGGGGESDPTGEKFECHDDAGYTNVNQVCVMHVCFYCVSSSKMTSI